MEENTLRFFISFADADKAYLDLLKKHLKPLENTKQISIWDRTLAIGGENLETKFKHELLNAHVVLLLISSDFFNTDTEEKFIEKAEFVSVIEKHQKGEIRVIPVILKPYDWQTYPILKGLNPLPTGGTTITSNADGQDAACFEVVDGIKKVIKSILETGSFKPNSNAQHNNLIDSSQPITGYPESPDPNALSICIFKKQLDQRADLFSGIIYPPQNTAKKEALKIPSIATGFPAKVVDAMQRIMLKRDGMETIVGDEDFKVLGEAMFHHLLPSEEARSFFLSRYQALKAAGLKIILQFDEHTKKIATMPWEYLYVPEYNGEAGFFIGEKDSLTLTRRLKRDSNLKIDSMTLSKIGIIKLFSAKYADEEVKAVESEITKWNPKFVPETQEADTFDHFKEKVKSTQYGIVHFFGEFEMDEKQSCILFKKEKGDPEKISLKKLLEAFQNKPKVVFLHSTSGTQSDALRNAAFELVDVVDGAIAFQFQNTESQGGAVLISSFYTHLSPESDFESAAAAIARELVKNHPRLGISTSFAKDSFKVLMPKEETQIQTYKCYHELKAHYKNGIRQPNCNEVIKWDFDNLSKNENARCFCNDEVICNAGPLWPCPVCLKPEHLTKLNDGVEKCPDGGHEIKDWLEKGDPAKTHLMPPFIKDYIKDLKSKSPKLETSSKPEMEHKAPQTASGHLAIDPNLSSADSLNPFDKSDQVKANKKGAEDKKRKVAQQGILSDDVTDDKVSLKKSFQFLKE
ncbi:MAG: toll/interleukin-1 receptor domain-containing protein [Saprospiraceae bacterium]|nr:toll/interleukin-1 receptor domain-containing protein [Saprospiraceae bacterium]